MNSSRTLWKAIAEGQASALARWTLGPLLTTLSYPYDWGHQLRLQAYRLKVATVRRLPCRVISIGNLTLGGTGKTPVVELVAGLLRREGMRVGVLSRGYGGRSQSAITIVSDGKRCLVPPEVAGDEPVLLAEHLVGLPVVVGKDRYAAGMLAIERFGVEVIVLDDGFQHVQLARDFNVLLLDAVRPLGNGRLFPRGDLRERATGMARADAIVFTRWDAEAAPSLISPETRVNQGFRCSAASMNPSISVCWPMDTACHLHPSKAAASWRFAVLARLTIFTRHFKDWRLRSSLSPYFPTIIHIRARRSSQLVQMANQHGADTLITTEKDGVRLRGLQPWTRQVWELRIRATIVVQEAAWRDMYTAKRVTAERRRKQSWPLSWYMTGSYRRLVRKSCGGVHS